MMKRLAVLFAVLILFSGGTTISKKRVEQKPAQKSSIEKLSDVAIKLDTTASKLNHSTTALNEL